MSKIITMPQKGLTEESSILSGWYVKAGDEVKAGTPLFAIEIGKAVFDVESEVEGTVLALFAEEGEDVPIKAPVCVIGKPGESFERPAAVKKSEAPAPAKENRVGESRPAPAAALSEEGVFASPRAKAAAERAGLDYRDAVPSGAEGRVLERDVLKLRDAGRAAAEPPREEEYTVVPNSGIRKVIAANMHSSLSEMAQLSMTAYFNAETILSLREKFKREGKEIGCEKISVNDMILFAVSRVVPAHPGFNAHYSEKEMKLFRPVHLGVAVDTERGLMVPTLSNADRLSLKEISSGAAALAAACRNNTVRPEQLAGGTITVTNLGNTGISSFTPIINPPQTCIVGICGIEWKLRPSADGSPSLYRAIGLSLTFDHRAVDGAPAARFLHDLCTKLENFELLLIE